MLSRPIVEEILLKTGMALKIDKHKAIIKLFQLTPGF